MDLFLYTLKQRSHCAFMAGSAGDAIASLKGDDVTAGGGLIGEKTTPSDDDRRKLEAENGKIPSF